MATKKNAEFDNTNRQQVELKQPIKVDITNTANNISDEIRNGVEYIGSRMDSIAESVSKDNSSRKINELTNQIRSGVPVRLQRTSVTPTSDLALWTVIRKSTEAINFENYSRFIETVLYERVGNIEKILPMNLRNRVFIPIAETNLYGLLKTATEAFLLVNTGIPLEKIEFDANDISELNERLGAAGYKESDIESFWKKYLGATNGSNNSMLPYLEIVRNKFKNDALLEELFDDEPESDEDSEFVAANSMNALRRKSYSPFLFELIWSYWHEEGMLVQTFNSIMRRFQNVRSPLAERDPLIGMEIDTLRPLNSLIWGFLQDEVHRLSLVRRAYEYDHHYGITLQGKAVPKINSADSRSKFVEGFHNLLRLCSVFFRQDDDTTIIADGFPVLNALKEVHLTLSQGAHNQFGDLPSVARQEMLIQQWILSRPEFREFLPTRAAVAYPEPWMDRVEAMKTLQGWTDTSIIHFHNLAVFGEQILLGIRYGAWSSVNQPAQAANWARFWRAEIQGYIHAYRAATGVDLSSASTTRVDGTPPSVLLQNRYLLQERR